MHLQYTSCVFVLHSHCFSIKIITYQEFEEENKTKQNSQSSKIGKIRVKRFCSCLDFTSMFFSVFYNFPENLSLHHLEKHLWSVRKFLFKLHCLKPFLEPLSNRLKGFSTITSHKILNKIKSKFKIIIIL